ncbi:MAG: efflux RND transporter periplasmic adaptor subunit [Cyclobacteriaceae bacterium]
MKTRIIIFGIAIALVLGVTVKLRSNKLEVDNNIYRPDLERNVLVKAATVMYQALDKTFSYTGTFAPNREVMIVPQVQGQVEEVYFNEGDVVRQGAAMVQVDDDVLQTQYVAAQANYEIAKRNLDRYENASIGGGVSNLQLDNYRLSYKNAEANLKQLLKQIEWSRITAPFTGTVTFKDVEIGSIVGSKALARITDMSLLKLEISVPEREIAMFTEGKEVLVNTDIYPGQTLKGKVDYVSHRADDSHNYMVRVVIQNASHNSMLKAGMYGTAIIDHSETSKAIIMPRTALLGSAKNPQVFVIENGKAVLREIKTGTASNETIEVIEGLREGDTVVTSGQINLSNGSNVQITN